MCIEMKFIFFVLYVLQFLPFALLHKLADLTGLLAYLLVKPRRRIGEINLAKCFPEWDGKKRETVLKQHFKHMAKLMLEYGLYWYAPAGRLKSLVRYRNKHYLDDALAAGEKVIILYPHFTAFEMAVYALNQDVPLISMYSHQKNKILDEQILKGRNRYHNVFLIGRTEGLRALVKQFRKSSAPARSGFRTQRFGFCGFFRYSDGNDYRLEPHCRACKCQSDSRHPRQGGGQYGYTAFLPGLEILSG